MTISYSTFNVCKQSDISTCCLQLGEPSFSLEQSNQEEGYSLVTLKSTHFGHFSTLISKKKNSETCLHTNAFCNFHWKHFKFVLSLLHHWSNHQWHYQRFLWPRFSCPCVTGISLIPQNQTEVRKAAEKLNAVPHYDARRMMASARYICICTDSKRKPGDKVKSILRWAEHWEARNPCPATFYHLYFSEPIPHLTNGDYRVVVTWIKYWLLL